MKSQVIKFSSINVPERLRKEYHNIEKLARSIKDYGLLCPLLLDQNNSLVDGGRRHAACRLLGLEEVPVFYKEDVDEELYKELEMEANLQREDFTWQEKTIGIANLHELKKRKAVLSGDYSWGYRQTGALLGVNYASVSYAIRVAQKLRLELNADGSIKESAKYYKVDNFTAAYDLILKEEQDALQAELVKEHTSTMGGVLEFIEESVVLDNDIGQAVPEIPNSTTPFTDLEKDSARERYLSNPHNPPDEFEAYWKEKNERKVEAQKISLNWLLNVDSIEFMNCPENKERFDHIITDPPYGIDMSNLAQPNVSMVDIDTVEAEHEVEPNRLLLHSFFEAAYQCLKPNAYLAIWCDYDLWNFLKECATSFGFKIQRWPIVWHKLHNCMNGAAQFNFTKNTEICLIARKGTACLADSSSTSVIACAHDDYKEELGHPFVKPFECWEFLINHISFQGQTILEPFAGRGSGVISLLRKNRRVVACEKDKAHYNALLQNVKNHYLRINPDFTFVK